MVDQKRIEQFEKMAHDDPDNELGHFSLGKAYLEAGQFDDSARSFKRVLQINPNNSRAYALLASAELKANRRERALVVLRDGYRLARERGDMMPAREMAAMLTELGEPPTDAEAVSRPAALSGAGAEATGFRCVRCGSQGPRLPEPPMRGELGRQAHEQVCASCWREWIHMGTKVINELRLDFTDPQAQDVFDLHMKEFLNLS